MTVHDDSYYHSVASIQGRAALSGDATGRAVMPMGKWQRCNPTLELVWVDDAEGTPRALTPKQAQVLYAALDMIDGTGVTMRALAKSLSVAPSTVSRALTKLAAWGLIVYVVGRGRWAGLVIFRGVPSGMERFRKAAKDRVRRWSEAANRRISRLALNVASYIQEGRGDYDGYYHWSRTVTRTTDATLTAQPFTVQELRDMGII